MRGKKLAATCLIFVVLGWITLCFHPLKFSHNGVDVGIGGPGIGISVADELPSFLIIPFWPFVILIVLGAVLWRLLRSWKSRRRGRARGFEMSAATATAAEATATMIL